MTDPYRCCVLCPRECRTDRSRGETGYCGETSRIRAASACVHFGEEPPLTGKGGSGTVFFTGCTLKCGFCQNWQASRSGMGAELSTEELSRLFLRLQHAGAENINAVTGTQFAPSILEALALSRGAGLSIPMVWNSSGYETSEAIELLSRDVSFFLPDLKTLDEDFARHRLHASDYPARATRALLAMADAKPLLREGPDGQPSGGLIVRHLVLPGRLEDTRKVLSWFKGNLDGRALLSLMFQYTPIPGQALFAPYNRMVSAGEHEQALALLDEIGIEDGYFQEPVTDNAWLPDFGRRKPFPSELSRVVWHYLDRAADQP